MKNLVVGLVDKNRRKLEGLLRDKALKNVEIECLMRDIDINNIDPNKLEILIRSEEDKIKSKYKTNTIVLLLIALGLHA